MAVPGRHVVAGGMSGDVAAVLGPFWSQTAEERHLVVVWDDGARVGVVRPGAGPSGRVVLHV